MKILFTTSSPKQIYMFKSIGEILEQRGNEISYLIRNTEMNKQIAEYFNLSAEYYGKNLPGLIGKTTELLYNDYVAINIIKRISLYNHARPNLIVGDSLMGHPAKILNIPSIAFTDGTGIGLHKLLYHFYFSNIFVTPACCDIPVKKKVIKYHGLQELIYLHPKYFKPDPKVLDLLGVSRDTPFVIIRRSALKMSHDIGLRSLSDSNFEKLVDLLKEYAEVFISSEKPLNKKLSKMILKIPPYLFHSALYFSTLFIGDTAVSVEAALLGTPSIQISPVDIFGNPVFREYGCFLYTVNNGLMKMISSLEYDEIVIEAEKILNNISVLRKVQKELVLKFLERHIDVADFSAGLIEGYPRARGLMEKNKIGKIKN